MKILYVGETWQGSSARSLRDALAALPRVELDDIGEDHYFPKHRTLWLRGVNRLLRHVHRLELEREVTARLAALRPVVLVVYKGNGITANTVRLAQRAGVMAVNVFPDCSPHAHGSALREAVGEYDLVVSTKPFHPAGWQAIYGYRNRCVFVPHGYDPKVHYWPTPPEPGKTDLDVVMVAAWRPHYHDLVMQLAAKLRSKPIRVGIAGPGWQERARAFPANCVIERGMHGRGYGEYLRRGKIVIAPVNRDVVINGIRQPGDEDTTRTYELAAAHCFFVHQRTTYAQSVYNEQTEVPMWDDADELACIIDKYLQQSIVRADMARRAHERAVPAYSIPARARSILDYVTTELDRSGGSRARPK